MRDQNCKTYKRKFDLPCILSLIFLCGDAAFSCIHRTPSLTIFFLVILCMMRGSRKLNRPLTHCYFTLYTFEIIENGYIVTYTRKYMKGHKHHSRTVYLYVVNYNGISCVLHTLIHFLLLDLLRLIFLCHFPFCWCVRVLFSNFSKQINKLHYACHIQYRHFIIVDKKIVTLIKLFSFFPEEKQCSYNFFVIYLLSGFSSWGKNQIIR